MHRTGQIRPFIIAGLVIVACWTLFIVWAMNTGRWVPGGTSEITELGVCLREGIYAPVTTVPAGTTAVYACGMVEGSIRFPGGFNLMDEQQDRAIAQAPGRMPPPGPFFRKLEPSHALAPGRYRIEAWYAQKMRAVAPFEVVGM